MIACIACVDKNWGIGSNGDLLTKIPEDLKRFKKLTDKSIVVMGRKTYDSLPNKPLPNRQNVVITRSVNKFTKDKDNVCYTDMKSLRDFLSFCMITAHDVFIIGGGEIYKELLQWCDIAYITQIYKEYDNVDTYFPNLSEHEDWKIESSHAGGMDAEAPYGYITYVRTNYIFDKKKT